MPFGPYKDFEDCVSKNQDKDSPEGFCSFLEKQITGEYPGAGKHTLPNEYVEAYSAAMFAGKSEKDAAHLAEIAAFNAGYDMARFGWVKQYQAPKLRTIAGVKVFAAGTWTDSSGGTREWTDKHLDSMCEAFKAKVPKVVPLKCGHTSDAFNKKVAEALGVPIEVITGDKGQGQVGIGRMSSLERKGNLLVAAFDNVPEAISTLVEGGQYSTVSVEVEQKVGEYGPVITGVALLGSEEPAVDKASLAGASVFGGKREGAAVLSFQHSFERLEGVPVDVLVGEFQKLSTDLDAAIGKTKGAPVFRKLFDSFRKLFEDTIKPQKENEKKGESIIMDMKKLCAALGLPDTSTEADVMAAIEGLKKGAAAPADNHPAFASFKSKVTALETENADLKGKVTAFAAAQTKAEHETRVAGYLVVTKEFKAVPGTPEELARQLTELEEKAGKPAADLSLAAFKKAEELAVAAGVLKAQGSSRDGKPSTDFEAAVTKFQKENPNKTRAEAVKAVGVANPDLWNNRNK